MKTIQAILIMGQQNQNRKKILDIVRKTVAERLRCFCRTEIRSAVKALLCLLDALCIHKILTRNTGMATDETGRKTNQKKNHQSAPDLNNP